MHNGYFEAQLFADTCDSSAKILYFFKCNLIFFFILLKYRQRNETLTHKSLTYSFYIIYLNANNLFTKNETAN